MYTYGITGTSINEFQDVTITGVLDDQILQYNSSTGQWENVTASFGASNLDGLSDVVISSPSEFQILEYNGTSWVNQHASVTTYVRNADSVTLATGTAVYLFGATGDHASVKRADNDSDTTSSKTVGLVASPIAPGENGVVITRGYVDGINLSVGYSAGDILWLAEDGGFTKTKPVAPEHLVFIGVVVRATNNGIVYVAVQNGYELDELHNVKINGNLADNDVLAYDAATDLWKNSTAFNAGIAPLEPVFTPQTPIQSNYYTTYGIGNVANVGGANVPFVGGYTPIVFSTDTTVTGLALSLTVASGTTGTFNFRLGLYADDGSYKPGALIEDVGTIAVTSATAVGIKDAAFTSPRTFTANTIYWMALGVNQGGVGTTAPFLMGHTGSVLPFSNYGVANNSGLYAGAIGFRLQVDGSLALPASFTLDATQETVGYLPRVYAKVTV